ncbi:MAG: glucose 1-dehydrogenase [Chloroflexota bacterium]|nr:glucose 1-dehydrogenase [SAR202 cluster bacterium]MEC9321692.1 glucose 1-dehydrogenase [Chloroflexota bacterium]
MRLANKVAVITGASNGMGAAEARLFASEGAQVILADLLEKEGQEQVVQIRSSGGKAIFERLDVTLESQWDLLVHKVIERFGSLDILVNNAGISGSYQPDLMSVEAYDRIMNVNSKGVFLGMKYCLKQMVKHGKGSIVNISSISGMVGQEYTHMGYNASKGAVRIMTKSAAVQYADRGIRVNSVHPGIMPPMTTSVGTAEPKTREIMLKEVPMNRFGLVEEVANAVLFLASEEASYITGAELPVDGGLTAR